ncbi:hypothetical protein ACTWPT_57655 [Nonomuraea sp. 3N208]|uniref:hypothetical protein n=1 Tax=Nonomuraea sp. 3N208 TaxID=3457421 RepID=UPI003FD0422B
MVLVNRRVTVTWAVEAGAVIVTPLRRLSPTSRTTVAGQGRELAAFLANTKVIEYGSSPDPNKKHITGEMRLPSGYPEDWSRSRTQARVN